MISHVFSTLYHQSFDQFMGSYDCILNIDSNRYILAYSRFRLVNFLLSFLWQANVIRKTTVLDVMRRLLQVSRLLSPTQPFPKLESDVLLT